MSDTVENMDNVEQTPDAEDMSHDVLAMSDEEFMAASETDLAGQATNLDNGEDEQGVPTELPEESNDDSAQNLGDGNVDDEDQSNEANEEDEDDTAEASESEQASEDEDSQDNQPENADGESDIDYEAEYKKLFQPIKSSGREIKMRNVDHVRNYIQMGDDYNKKMHELKPFMKSLRTLQANELIGKGTSDERLNFLIELDQKKPEAIKRLIAESGLDIYELQDEDKFSPEEAKKYKPEDRMVSEAEMEIEDAIKDISDSKEFDRTIDVMTNQFDEKSRDIIADNPAYIKSLNHDIENGSYDVIMDEVKYARDMKMIPNEMSDIEAYIATVQMINQKNTQAGTTETATTKPKRSSNKKKKIGMSSSSSRPAKKKDINNQDFMAMSDEEFAKLDSGVL